MIFHFNFSPFNKLKEFHWGTHNIPMGGTGFLTYPLFKNMVPAPIKITTIIYNRYITGLYKEVNNKINNLRIKNSQAFII